MTRSGRPTYPPGQRRHRGPPSRPQPGISNHAVVAICIGCCLCGPCYCLFSLLKSRCQDLHRRVTRRIEQKREERNRSPLVLLGSRPRFGYPAWPGARARPITPPPSPPAGDASLFKTTAQTGPFFTRLPLEVRRLVYDFALGADLVWLEAWGGRLVAQRCSSLTREFWSQNGRWKTAPARHYKTMSDLQYEGGEYRRHAANLNLLLTCRQVYLEAIASLYTASTFVVFMETSRPTLPYLSYFLLPQRLERIRSLCIQWNLDMGSVKETEWDQCWDFVARLPDLQDVSIRFECDDVYQGPWLYTLFPTRFEDCVAKVKVAKRFIVVLPFLDGGLVMHSEGSKIRYEKMEVIEWPSPSDDEGEWYS